MELMIHSQAKALGKKYFFPGVACKTVCGLHVENNLQLLRASQNARKQNKFSGVY